MLRRLFYGSALTVMRVHPYMTVCLFKLIFTEKYSRNFVTSTC